ncbi:hypothetical protein PHLGIDRAFT_125463 [Phlebiopsis gigantea 11061_1 CR5-6]|uniref:Ribosomal protein S36, mitochondrial n=1 Tax=Phlebiopsis gigantea (strain 11061_1 CR5-6) TaxID=745531 RepID=A0A0C3SC47_PHLG1|nr:hypothetical protein PHLGIDRAFT_125463 [Phlebiopsis gigantea 11061_1 CR5-6]
MRPSLRLANAATHRVHTPLIRFVGRRQWPSTPEPQHPHPFAPPELQKSFSDFLNKFKSSATALSSPGTKKGGSTPVFEDFWQAPERYWKTKISEQEMEAISSGGAF